MDHKNKYFPERYVANRHFANRMLKLFNESDFDPDYSKPIDEIRDIDELREFIRQPVKEWNINVHYPDYILAERDRIREELSSKYPRNLENPTEESREEYKRQSEEMFQSDIWKRWETFLEKMDSMNIDEHPRLDQENFISRDVIRFYQNGRNIFEFSPLLTQLFEKKDVGNVRFRDFKLPYKTVYFHFGTIDGLEYPLEYYEDRLSVYIAETLEFETDEEEDEFYRNKKFLLEGAFVTVTRESCIDIQLCFKDPTDDFIKKVNIIDDHRFPTFDFTLSFEKLNSAGGGSRHDDDSTFHESAIIFRDYWDYGSAFDEIEYGELSRLVNEPDDCDESEWKQYVLMDKALKLVVNCICYVTTNKEDAELFATHEQATELLKELSKTKKVQLRNKLTEKLSKLSYSKVYLLGHKASFKP